MVFFLIINFRHVIIIFIINQQSINNALIITNGLSSKLKNLDDNKFNSAVFEPLDNLGIKYDVINRPSESDLDILIEEDSLLVICGGDGTVTRIVDYAAKNSLSNILLPLPFGGANDIATGLYGSMTLENIITAGTPNTAYTIETIVQKDNLKQKTIRALGYIGIGTSGHAAKAINSYRGEDITEFDVIARVAQSALMCDSFTYLDSDNNERTAAEILAIKHRMARYILASEITTFNHEFISIEMVNKIQMLGKFCLGLFGKATGQRIGKDQNQYIQTLSPTVLQADGESINIEPRTKIIIKNGPPINVMCIAK